MASSIEAIPTKALEELLECSLCLETLTNPRTLSCFHSFCKHCLEEFVQHPRDGSDDQQPNAFECPVCRSLFTLHATQGVEGIGRNFFVCNMLDMLAIESRVKAIPCHHCQKENNNKAAVGRCVDCEVFICNECIVAHNNYPGFKGHDVLSMEELSKPQNRSKITGKLRCREHDDELIKFFCETCKELICRDCKDYNHEDHQCLPLKRAAEHKTKELRKWYADLTEKYNKSNEALKAMDDALQALDDNVTETKETLRKRRDDILAAVTRGLDDKVKALTTEIDAKSELKRLALNKQLEESLSYTNQVKISMALCRSLFENDNAAEILSSHGLVEKNVEEVETEQPTDWKLVDDGNIQFDQRPLELEPIKELLRELGEIKDERSKGAVTVQLGELKMMAYKGDITEEEADVIVNGCSGFLSHKHGVSLAILKAGGKSIQKECDEYVRQHGGLSSGDSIVTKAGRLKCKYVLHAFGPHWEKCSESESIDLLEKALKSIFMKALALKARSIAMPAISTGGLGVPKELFAIVLMKVVRELKDHFGKPGEPFLFRVVDIDEEKVHAVEHELLG